MTKIELIQTIIGIAQTLATILISFVLYRQAKLFKKIEIQGNTTDAYNVLNTIAISSDDNLKAFDSIGRDNLIEDITIRRKRWCGFVWLQALQQTYFAMDSKILDTDYAKQTLEQQLKVILLDDDIYWLVCYRGFSPKFSNYCAHIRKELGKLEQIPYDMKPNNCDKAPVN